MWSKSTKIKITHPLIPGILISLRHLYLQECGIRMEEQRIHTKCFVADRLAQNVDIFPLRKSYFDG